MKSMDLNEKKQHGVTGFPLEHYLVDPNHSEYEMQLHWHKEFEIVRVNRGFLRLYLNNILYELKSGDIALIGCEVLHRGDPKECSYECLVFDLNMLRHHNGDSITPKILPIMKGDVSANRLINPDNGILYSTANQLFNAAGEKREFYEFSLYSLLYRLFGLLYEQQLLPQNIINRHIGHQTEVMTTLLDWIESHYAEPITLTQMGLISGTNEKYLCRLFREYTNRTPLDYVNHLRIECAIHEMLVNNRSITEAAFECGFNDPSYFSRAFKKHKGVSPKQFLALRKSGDR